MSRMDYMLNAHYLYIHYIHALLLLSVTHKLSTNSDNCTYI